ncbi:hypothetical protein [Streptomyces griseosporeus]|uniref:hypothetical protein n=1 Tax=Streptomyces griseosporeus TaxID=1910 RepID=UPI00167DAD4F|nr:hypothetical protein [Streptomyces griseosporeus]GHF40378.1 hypothetical protein GCM10018783_06210 [Streptomyces griseosporeus]
MSDDRKPPATALEEVLREIRDAERRTHDDDKNRHDGEAADTITPSVTAQEEAQGD